MSEHKTLKDASLSSPVGHAKHSEAVMGHEGTSYENTDAKAGVVITSLSIIWGTLLLVGAITVGVQVFLQKTNPRGSLPSPIAPARILPPSPQLQVHPWEELPDLRAHEEQVLNSFGKDENGHVHIPINQAMAAIPGRVQVAPNAPQGITTPGGEGRDFARSVNDMPPPYKRPPTIQGEIRKRAQ